MTLADCVFANSALPLAPICDASDALRVVKSDSNRFAQCPGDNPVGGSTSCTGSHSLISSGDR